MMSPTGKGIRSDHEGDGNYGASRGSRIHNGIDYLCTEGQIVVAPFGITITRVANPKAKSPLSGIAWRRGKSSGKMFYFKPYSDLIGKKVKQGETIGIAQSVSRDYGLPKMKDHIHFQVDK